MKNNLSGFLFMLMILSGLNLSVSSNDWLMIWCGLEISLISFIPFMISSKMISSGSSMKYFVIQSVSSALLIMGLMFILMDFSSSMMHIINISLFIKMGVAPFHNWVLTVVEGLEFMYMFILITILKIVPIMMLSYMNNSILALIVGLTLIMGSVMGLNQNSIRKLLTYSSIFNMGFILSIININFLWSMCLLIYSMLVFMMIILSMKNNFNYINQLLTNMNSMLLKTTIWLTLLSMGGLPPMTGFFVKLMVTEYLILNSEIMLLLMIIMFSLIVMFFYYRMTFLSIMMFCHTPKYLVNTKSKLYILILILNLLLFPMMFSFKVLT
nr:NADH dehydrogenase subunit 2 [Sobrala sp. SL-2021a]